MVAVARASPRLLWMRAPQQTGELVQERRERGASCRCAAGHREAFKLVLLAPGRQAGSWTWRFFNCERTVADPAHVVVGQRQLLERR